MAREKRKPSARTPRTTGLASPTTGAGNAPTDRPDEVRQHPQGAGGVDVADDAGRGEHRQAKRRLRRVLR